MKSQLPPSPPSSEGIEEPAVSALRTQLPEWSATMTDGKLDQLRSWLSEIFVRYDKEFQQTEKKIGEISKDVRNLVYQDQTTNENFATIGCHIEDVKGWMAGGVPPPPAARNDEVAELKRELQESKVVISQYSVDVQNMFNEHTAALLKLDALETATDLDLETLKARLDGYTKDLEKNLSECNRKIDEGLKENSKVVNESKGAVKSVIELRDHVRTLASDLDDKLKQTATPEGAKLGRFQSSSANATKVRLDLVDECIAQHTAALKSLQESLAFMEAVMDFAPKDGAGAQHSASASGSACGPHSGCPCVTLNH
jgi:hypothetical protein